MDEYLFLTMAKLKADRRKLEREQRAEARRRESETHASKPDRPAQAASEFIPLLNWR
jgi:hypothetical protein